MEVLVCVLVRPQIPRIFKLTGLILLDVVHGNSFVGVS